MKLTITRTEEIDTDDILRRLNEGHEASMCIRALVSRVSELEAAAKAKRLDLPDCNTFEVIGTGASGTSATAQCGPAPRWPTDSKGNQWRKPIVGDYFYTKTCSPNRWQKCVIPWTGSERWVAPNGEPGNGPPDAFAPRAAPATEGVEEIGGGWTTGHSRDGARWFTHATCDLSQTTGIHRETEPKALTDLSRAASIGFKAGDGIVIAAEDAAHLHWQHTHSVDADAPHPGLNSDRLGEATRAAYQRWLSRRAAGERTGG